ncbi:MAG: DNA processing protein DprA [Cyclobacteriaceae bacterium]|nr:MAG: DNA processing protein DprA [Cyclobacteriaceae bacterium]
MHPEHLQQVALSLLPGIGPVTVKQLISYCGKASNVFNTPVSKLSAIPGIGLRTAKKIHLSNSLDRAREQIKLALIAGSKTLFFTDEVYPERLKNLPDAPSLLFTKGKPAYNHSRTLGIVGTRRSTNYGATVVRRLLTQLNHYKPTIISGLAYGIDIKAHTEALRLGLPTIGVLGSGLDSIYPAAHQNIARQMLGKGSLITELPFGTKPEMYHFPNRNRIIAGLSDALVVVEARRKGGAMITVDYTMEYGKPCFAIPGPIDGPASFGCNELIKNKKASILTCGEDIASLLRWDCLNPVITSREPQNTESRILEILGRFPQGLHIDKLCRITQTPINKMGRIILSLEIQGLIKAVPGKKFTLAGK